MPNKKNIVESNARSLKEEAMIQLKTLGVSCINNFADFLKSMANKAIDCGKQKIQDEIIKKLSA